MDLQPAYKPASAKADGRGDGGELLLQGARVLGPQAQELLLGVWEGLERGVGVLVEELGRDDLERSVGDGDSLDARDRPRERGREGGPGSTDFGVGRLEQWREPGVSGRAG